ncbi:MAG TPA: response regulator transcription factor [Ruminiclostridium sp.]
MYKVLIADDEPFILEGLANIINWEEYGLEIVGLVNNGLEAKDIIDSHNVNLLITDIKMPKMAGLELIRYIKREKKNIKCIVLSGYNDFEYVKEAAKLGIENYLLKPVDDEEFISTLINTVDTIENELCENKEIQQGLKILRDNILLRWVTNNVSDRELREKASFLNINIKNSHFLVAILKISTKSIYDNPDIDDSILLRASIQNICCQTITESTLGTVFHDIDSDFILLFSGNDLLNRIPEIKKVLYDCKQNINMNLKVDVFVSVGSVEVDYRLVYRSYKQAKTIQDYCLVLGYNHVLFYDRVAVSPGKAFIDIKDDLMALNEALRCRELQSINSVIKDIFTKFHNIENLNPSAIRNITVTILFSMVNFVRSLNSNTSTVFEDANELFFNVYKFETLYDLENWLKEMALTCINILDSEEHKQSPSIRKILSYLNSHYNNDINLKTVASEFELNAFYLGQLFKSEVGDSFTNYLNNLRINRAKELIMEGKYKNNEIAEKVGYINTNYFSTIFKKATGMSPTEFKDNKSLTF